jgi:two-component system, NarL family, nitrate/nitrite response regulator NarL
MRLFVISDIRLYREGLCEVLARREGIELVGSEPDVGHATATLIRLDLAPDVALIDVADTEGLDALRRFAEALPDLSIVAITVPNRPGDVIACAEAGAAGFVTRDASVDELVEALEAIGRGEVRCSPRMTAALLRRVSSLARERTEVSTLTQREREILGLIDAGLSNKVIAEQLSIEVPTVKNHVHRIIEKLGVTNRGQAAARMRAHLAQ